MRQTTAMSGVALAVVAVSLALAGCSSSNKPAASSSSSSSSSTTSSATAASKIAPPSAQPTTGPNPTIATYIQQNLIHETPVHKGDPGAPTINDPVPDGWQSAGNDTPDWAYSAIVYSNAEAAQYTPNIETILSKLTGNVDPQQIINLAPGELNNLPGYQVINAGSASTLSGFPAYQLAGTWDDNGQTEMVSQKTVVIPAGDAVYVLQLNAHGLQSQQDILQAATNVIDQQTTIKVS
jgi:Probable lipoprotein LpqN